MQEEKLVGICVSAFPRDHQYAEPVTWARALHCLGTVKVMQGTVLKQRRDAWVGWATRRSMRIRMGVGLTPVAGAAPKSGVQLFPAGNPPSFPHWMEQRQVGSSPADAGA